MPKGTTLKDEQAGLTARVKLSAASAITFLVAAIAIRLGWECTDRFSIEAFATVSLSILAVLGIGALVILVIFRPERLVSRSFSVAFVGLVLLGLVGGLLHYVRFVFISEVPSLAIAVATALLLASLSGFALVLYGIRLLRLTEERKQPPRDED
jgi:hypothetical protein